jgi:hypothetical protein
VFVCLPQGSTCASTILEFGSVLCYLTRTQTKPNCSKC